MKIAGINKINFKGIEERKEYEANPITENFARLTQDEKLNALH